MAESCSYFDSKAWNNRLNEYIRRSWELEHPLRESDRHTFPDSLTNIATDIEGITADEAAQMVIGEIEEYVNLTDHKLSMDTVRSLWKQQADIPDTCPYRVHAASETYCLCHMAPESRRDAGIDNNDIVTWIQDRLQNTIGGDTYSFVGARFQQLDLSNEVITTNDNRSVDFRFLTIQERLTCTNTVFDQTIRFKGSQLGLQVTSDNIQDGIQYGNHFVDFNAAIDFTRAEFRDTADFKFSLFATDTSFNNATFEAGMFNYSSFQGRADFMAAAFNGKADFSKSQFHCAAMLNGTYHSAAIFNYTIFDSNVAIWTTTFDGKAEFWATVVRGDLNGSYAEFNDQVHFEETTFEGTVTLKHASFDGRICFRDVTSVEPISLRYAVLKRGVIRLPVNDPPFYDIRHAVVGNIKFCADNLVVDKLFEYFYIHKTEFKDFDFAEYSAHLRPDWKLHTNAAEGAPFMNEQSPEALEATYLKAKQGAKAVGHNKAASEFFFHEMRFRKRQHKEQARESLAAILSDTSGSLTTSMISSVRWISNATLGHVAGYGERPRNVIACSLVIVFGFAVMYPILDTEDVYGGVIGEEYLLLSFQSFITFILGQTPRQATFWFEFATAVQGFIGAFLIALLVFTLTRSIHR